MANCEAIYALARCFARPALKIVPLPLELCGGERGRCAAEEGGVAEGLNGSEIQELSAFEVAQFLAAEGVEVAVKKLDAVDMAIGAAGRADGLALGVGGGADDARAKKRGGRSLGFGG